MKSYIYFQGKAGFRLFGGAKAKLLLGDHPRAEALRSLEAGPDAIFTAFIPDVTGILDDYFESWFLVDHELPALAPEGLSSVVSLGLSETWLPPPTAPVPGVHE